MPQLSDVDIAQYAANAGFSGDDLNTAVAVALAESGGVSDRLGDVNLQNATYGPSVGLWQIRSVNAGHGNAFDQAHRNAQANLDPSTNAANAYAIQQNPAGHGWNEWSTYSHGDYQQYLDRARNATSQLGQQGSTDPSQLPTDPSQQQNQNPLANLMPQQPSSSTPSSSTPSSSTPSSSTPSSSQNGQGDQQLTSELEKLIEAIEKLVGPQGKLGKASQTAKGAKAGSEAFGKVPGSSTAHQKHTKNTNDCGEHAQRGSDKVSEYRGSIDSSKTAYADFSAQSAQQMGSTGQPMTETSSMPTLTQNVG